MRKFSTSLFIALLALLALPERVWAEDVSVKFLVRVQGSDVPSLYLWYNNGSNNVPLNGDWANTPITTETETINGKTYYKYTITVPTATDLKLITKKSGDVNGEGNQSDDSAPFQINSGVSYVLVEGSFNKSTKPIVEVVETGSETGHTFYLGCATNNWKKDEGYKFTSESSSGPYTYTLAKENVSAFTDGYFYVSILPYYNGKQWGSDKGNVERICPTNGDKTELTSSASNSNAQVSTTFTSWKVKYVENATDYVFTFNHSNMSFSVVPTLVSETKYTVTISAGEGGSVTPSGDQQIGSTPVEVTATAKSGYEFVNWTVTGGAKVANASSPTTTVTATQDGTLKANFKAKGSTPPTPAPQVEEVKLYVKNAAGWTGDMYAYVFTSTGSNAAYPGVKMESVSDNDNYNFEYTVPEGYENGYVIFSNGSSEGSKRFPADKRSGFGIRNASHIFNNDNNTWIAPQSSTIEGQNSVTIYAYINNDMAWYPTDGEDGTNGDIKIGTNFYIFAYTNATNSDYHAYVEGSDTKLTINDYNPGYGKTAGTDINDYGDYCDETVYPVGYGSASNLRYAKFVIYYDKELEGQTAFYTLNSGSLGTGQTNYKQGYQIRQLFKANPQNIGETYKGTPYYYELPSVKLENGTSYSFRLGYEGYEHQNQNNSFIAFINYKIEDATSETVAGNIFPTVKLDDDYNCKKGIDDNSKGPFFSEEETTNIWEEAKTYNVNMYRPFYSDGLYETICLPFDVPATEVSEKFGSGTQLFKVTAANETTITFTEQTEANCYIEAGVPYIILPKLSGVDKSNWGAGEDNGTVITFAAKEMKYAYNEESQQKALSYRDKDNVDQSLTMKGCFIPHLIGKADRFFNTTADNEKVFYQQAYNDRRVIRGTRVFFNDTKDPEVTVSAGGQSQATKRIVLRFDSDQSEATGIYTPETGKVEIFRDARIYSISGQYVGSSLDKLAKGIYVVNGKKIVIR